jgi:hypothetical protein
LLEFGNSLPGCGKVGCKLVFVSCPGLEAGGQCQRRCELSLQIGYTGFGLIQISLRRGQLTGQSGRIAGP